MTAPVFIIEVAVPPPSRRGMRASSPQRDHIAALLPGQVLRWREDYAQRNRVNNAVQAVKAKHPGRVFVTRKENGGYDIYRTA